MKSFFSKLARKIDLGKFPLIAFIKIDGVPVAGAICLQGSHCLEYFIATYDKDYAQYSVEIALLLSVAEIAHARGLVFDMRYSHEPYKEFWSNQQPYFRVHRLYLTRSNLKIGLIVLAFAASRALYLKRRKIA